MDQFKVEVKPEEQVTEKFWNNPENILRLIDLIFFYDDNNTLPPS